MTPVRNFELCAGKDMPCIQNPTKYYSSILGSISVRDLLPLYIINKSLINLSLVQHICVVRSNLYNIIATVRLVIRYVLMLCLASIRHNIIVLSLGDSKPVHLVNLA